jgi:hypothetical protein
MNIKITEECKFTKNAFVKRVFSTEAHIYTFVPGLGRRVMMGQDTNNEEVIAASILTVKTQAAESILKLSK